MVSCHMLPHVAMFVVKIYLIFTVSKCKYIYMYVMYIYISNMEFGAPNALESTLLHRGVIPGSKCCYEGNRP